jgi:hypothetical protein
MIPESQQPTTPAPATPKEVTDWSATIILCVLTFVVSIGLGYLWGWREQKHDDEVMLVERGHAYWGFNAEGDRVCMLKDFPMK